MRTKTPGSRARLSKLPPASTTSRPLPLLNLNGEFNMDSIENDVAPDSIDKTDVCVMDMDLLEGETCIRCDRGGNVLVCCETGCPIALHEKCMNSEPKFDVLGKFYCPYCWYKGQVKRTKELRKRAMLAKKALSNFIDLKMVGGDGKELNMSQLGSDNDEVENGYLRVEEERENDGDNVKPADYDQCGIVDEHQMDPLPSVVVHGVDNVHHGQEEMTPGIESLQGSRSEEKLDEEGVSETHEYEVVEDGERLQAEISRQVDDTQHEDVIEDHECEVLEDGERIQAEVSRQVDDSQHEDVIGDHASEVVEDGERIQAEPLNDWHMEEEETEDGSHHASTKGICDTARVCEEKQERTEEEEQKHSKAPETTLLPTRGDTAPKVPAEDAAGSESSDSDTEAFSVRQRRIKQRSKKKARIQNVDSPKKSPFQRKKAPQNTSSQPGTRNRNKKVTTTKKSRQPQESANRFTNLTFANEKRKRLHWTAEEEDMLKEGVQKFSTTVNKNLPWRKILEFGRHVFDVTRTPIDLKDKWRNIMAKESSAMNRR